MPLASLRMKAIASAKARPIFSHSDLRFSQVSGLVASTLKASGDRCGGSPSAPLATSTVVPSTVPLRVHGSTVDMPSIARVCIAASMLSPAIGATRMLSGSSPPIAATIRR